MLLAGSATGNSSFGTFARWGYDWAVGATWNMHKEKWFAISDVLNTLRLKASIGTTGNSNVDTSSAYGTYKYDDAYSYAGMTGASQSSPANPGLSWEKCRTTDASVTFGLFNKVEVELGYYNKYTYDLIYGGYVSAVITGNKVNRNVGIISHNGYEITINATPVSRENFKWNVSFNGSRNSNMVKKLYKDTHTGFFDTVWIEGATKDAWWLVRWAGVDPVDGSPLWYDINGNLTRTFTYDNRVLLPEYDKQHKLYGGMTHRLQMKNFTASFQFTYGMGGWELFTYRTDGYNLMDKNVVVEEYDHWNKPGDL